MTKYKVELMSNNKIVYKNDAASEVEARLAMRKHINHDELFPYIILKKASQSGAVSHYNKKHNKGYSIIKHLH